MKAGLVRLTGERDIFYDSIDKIYRYRMHCPGCKKVIPTCRCYGEDTGGLDRLLIDIDDGIADCTCSSKCALVINDCCEVAEVMQEAGFEKDLRACLNQLTEEQSLDVLKKSKYCLSTVLMALFDRDSNIPISHIKNPTHEERLEILWLLGDVKEILQENNIKYQPDIKDLSEDEATKVMDLLTSDGDGDYPGGEACAI